MDREKTPIHDVDELIYQFYGLKTDPTFHYKPIYENVLA